MKVRDLNKSAERFKTKAGASQGEYVQGVQGAGSAWKSGVEASHDRWKEGVAMASSRGAYAKGVGKTPGEYYAARAVKLGGQRYASGIAEGAGNWAEGFKPYADTLASLQQSPKGPKGDPRNQQRSIEVQIALRNKKTEAA